MKLKKLVPGLVSGIINNGYDKEFKAIQSLSMPKIKSGANLFLIGPKDSGKTTALVMGIVQLLKENKDGAPRAIVMASSKEKAYEIEQLIDTLGKEVELTTFVAFDQGSLQYQKDMIYEGLDVLIGTPKRLAELLNAMGIPMANVKIFAVDDTHEMSITSYAKYIYRFADTVESAQLIMVADRWSENFTRIQARVMEYAQIVKVD